jgi:acyl CoA:acetate/3-ketoacid CoA transferase beta subunit/acyl CoA:acetate/3-ketoacid CoA transferase alpha subunit
VSRQLVRKLIVSFCGENYPTPGPNRVFQEAIDTRAVEIENVSLLALYQRLAAGALGLPFTATRSWSHSSLASGPSFAMVPNPFGGGDPVGVVSALVPDIVFVHALAADTEGNLLLSPPFGEGETAAFAARVGVIATVERIVDADVVCRHAHLMKVPAHRVLSISETPLGGHPYGIYSPIPDVVPGYVDDYNFFIELRTAARKRDSFDQWVARWILDTGSHEGYLTALGTRSDGLYRSAENGRWREELRQDTALARALAPTPANANETMVVAASRVLAEKARAANLPVIEAGVGFANLAAWLAAAGLRQQGMEADLVAEIGMYGYTPQPGDPFIFSQRNLATCKSMTGTEAVLGMYVGGRHNQCIAIIGAAQVDPQGNINSSYGDDGRFLVGSGGANDIASSAADVIVVTQQSRRRLANRVAYVTSLGDRVSTVVTDKGVFRKLDGRFVLTEYFPQAGRTSDQVLADIRETCEWDFRVAHDVVESRLPTRDELDRLRLFDLKRDFLG